MIEVILGLGSNMGNSVEILKSAVAELNKYIESPKVSSVYKTSPQDYFEQDDFYNLVYAGLYHESAFNLLDVVHNIENSHGRDRQKSVHKGPRFLDIDILFFGDQKINTKNLIVPHYAIKKRQFVLIPLLEIIPDFIDPWCGEAYSIISKLLPDQGVEKLNISVM